jgi:hypothetical protein
MMWVLATALPAVTEASAPDALIASLDTNTAFTVVDSSVLSPCSSILNTRWIDLVVTLPVY